MCVVLSKIVSNLSIRLFPSIIISEKKRGGFCQKKLSLNIIEKGNDVNLKCNEQILKKLQSSVDTFASEGHVGA